MAKDYKTALLHDFLDQLETTPHLNKHDQRSLQELQALIKDEKTTIPARLTTKTEIVDFMRSFFADYPCLLTKNNLDVLDQFSRTHFSAPAPAANKKRNK